MHDETWSEEEGGYICTEDATYTQVDYTQSIKDNNLPCIINCTSFIWSNKEKRAYKTKDRIVNVVETFYFGVDWSWTRS
jgi:hypothetical protein